VSTAFHARLKKANMLSVPCVGFLLVHCFSADKGQKIVAVEFTERNGPFGLDAKRELLHLL